MENSLIESSNTVQTSHKINKHNMMFPCKQSTLISATQLKTCSKSFYPKEKRQEFVAGQGSTQKWPLSNTSSSMSCSNSL